MQYIVYKIKLCWSCKYNIQGRVSLTHSQIYPLCFIHCINSLITACCVFPFILRYQTTHTHMTVCLHAHTYKHTRIILSLAVCWCFVQPSRCSSSNSEHHWSSNLLSTVRQIRLHGGSDWSDPDCLRSAVLPLLSDHAGCRLVWSQGESHLH